MPFIPDDGSAEPAGRIGSGLSPAAMIVQPDKVLQLKHRLEARRAKITNFILDKGDWMADVRPPGTDLCSKSTVQALGQNGQSAMEALHGFVTELTNTIDALDEAARLYQLVEDSNTDRFRQGPG